MLWVLHKNLAENSATMFSDPIVIVTCLKLKVKQMREIEYCIDTVLVVQGKRWVSEWCLLIRWQNFLFLHLVRSPTTLDPISSFTLVNYLHHLGNSNSVSTQTFFLVINKWRSSSSGRFASQDIRSSYLSNSSFRRLFSSEEALTK